MSFMTPRKPLCPPKPDGTATGLRARWICTATPDTGQLRLQLSWNCSG